MFDTHYDDWLEEHYMIKDRFMSDLNFDDFEPEEWEPAYYDWDEV